MVFTCDWSSSLRAVAKSCTASYISAVSVWGGARDNNIQKDVQKEPVTITSRKIFKGADDNNIQKDIQRSP